MQRCEYLRYIKVARYTQYDPPITRKKAVVANLSEECGLHTVECGQPRHSL